MDTMIICALVLLILWLIAKLGSFIIKHRTLCVVAILCAIAVGYNFHPEMSEHDRQEVLKKDIKDQEALRSSVLQIINKSNFKCYSALYAVESYDGSIKALCANNNNVAFGEEVATTENTTAYKIQLLGENKAGMRFKVIKDNETSKDALFTMWTQYLDKISK
ncbi:hypothetical protein [Escherichia coli]|uniref:hypothetical protein n=1 Tax=Escherichia coli TaxID=562 RepID=UPI000CFDA8BF|nr:hypothetical protein [Escherichia coli]